MSRKKIRTIIILATLSLVGLLAVQLTWLQKAYSLEEKEFNLSVNVALHQYFAKDPGRFRSHPSSTSRAAIIVQLFSGPGKCAY